MCAIYYAVLYRTDTNALNYSTTPYYHEPADSDNNETHVEHYKYASPTMYDNYPKQKTSGCGLFKSKKSIHKDKFCWCNGSVSHIRIASDIENVEIWNIFNKNISNVIDILCIDVIKTKPSTPDKLQVRFSHTPFVESPFSTDAKYITNSPFNLIWTQFPLIDY